MNLPKPDTEVLAKISHQYDLGESHWYEVVYHDGEEWQSFHGSKTFEDGERVEAWVYCAAVRFHLR